ncbi:hypothetical protein HZH68_016723 [Vespula germanica]|uniref:Uncharacterized protein n=1 Tax=Vespula germanica TaxID=30212 RepID=A0A834MP34_VESGE|nr:hypothetical protein HZH68_016723 [Vespula germanica]
MNDEEDDDDDDDDDDHDDDDDDDERTQKGKKETEHTRGRQVNVTKSTDTSIDPNGGRTDVRTDGTGWQAGKAESGRRSGKGLIHQRFFGMSCKKIKKKKNTGKDAKGTRTRDYETVGRYKQVGWLLLPGGRARRAAKGVVEGMQPLLEEEGCWMVGPGCTKTSSLYGERRRTGEGKNPVLPSQWRLESEKVD